MTKPCLRCGQLTPTGSYCQQHKPQQGGSHHIRGSGGKRATFRRRTLAITGGQCAVQGCQTPTDRVQAHHVVPLARGGDPDGPGIGIPLCHHHHRLTATSRSQTLL